MASVLPYLELMELEKLLLLNHSLMEQSLLLEVLALVASILQRGLIVQGV